VLTLVDDLNAQEIDFPHMEAGIAPDLSVLCVQPGFMRLSA
jgi:hypothetical protein